MSLEAKPRTRVWESGWEGNLHLTVNSYTAGGMLYHVLLYPHKTSFNHTFSAEYKVLLTLIKLSTLVILLKICILLQLVLYLTCQIQKLVSFLSSIPYVSSFIATVTTFMPNNEEKQRNMKPESFLGQTGLWLAGPWAPAGNRTLRCYGIDLIS